MAVDTIEIVRLSPKEAFEDFKARRAGILKALTTDAEKFFQECDPVKENLCLYGHPDETWQVKLPPLEVPDELPEPTVGINFARDGMKRHDWFKMVAVHSDSWLLAVAFFYAGQSKFDKESRNELFDMINDLPTMFEIMKGDAIDNKNQVKEGTSVGGRMANKSALKPVKETKVSRGRPQKRKKEDIEAIDRIEEVKVEEEDDEEEDEDEDEEEGEKEENSCGHCGKNSGSGKFWIFCDKCKCWFHGKCVGMTPALAEGIKKYACPSCSYKRTRDIAVDKTKIVRLSPKEAFEDFKARRSGILKALTTDAEKFFQECDPVKENLCLYGHPDETWQVKLPPLDVPDELPEPTVGINFARDGMKRHDWFKMVAVHSDSWLLAVAFFYAGQSKFDKESRHELFDMINDLPTMFDIMKEEEEEEDKEEEKDEEEKEGEKENSCGHCGKNSGSGKFWIFCDRCKCWFHGKCVGMTPALAEGIKEYACPSCSYKRTRGFI